ncbi:hypothetical protein HBI22_247680 [Parastagonospora nodorum]|nr:hypothetical protein HBI28_243400 [Parastagonospora nodorum]KAH5617748.1 hypothetical protein HBI22_247680 [Parastagonospora nodorum]
MAGRDSDDDKWYKSKANTISSNSMSQTNVREGYGITTLEVVELIEDLISYLRNAQIPKVFYEAAAGTIWTMMLAKVRYNTLTLILSKTAQRRSSSVVSNRSIASITNKFGVALLTEPAILNNANVALVDAVHHSVVMDALMMTLIEDDDDLLGTVNSYIKLRRLGARRKTEAADSRYAKVSGGRTKKDKDLEDSDTSSDVLRLCRRDRAAACARSAERKRLGKEAQLKKTRDEEELAKAKKEKEEKELTDAYILYFKELLSNNGGIFANAMSIGKTRAIVLATEVQNARAEGDAIEYNAVNDDDKLCPTKGERTFYCACERSLSFNIILEANTPAVHSEAIKHCLALSAARFVIVCGFGKVDKHMFRAYNTISRAILLPGYVTVWGRTVFDEFYNCKLEGIIMAKKGVSNWFNATDKRDSVTSDRIYKIEDAFKTYGSCKVKRFTLNSVKDLFTNLSKDYFLVREARAITKSSLNRIWSIAAEDAAKAANILPPLKEVCAKILIESYKLIVQAVT